MNKGGNYMWKINKLHLKNFTYIYSGMSKYDLEIDFSDNDNIINIFIGKMGSGKSAILGHLQPFSTYGTLDSRNQNSQILEEVDGLKEIEYIHDDDIYNIQHKYIWNKNTKSHNTKSYIQINGKEMNPNGNSNSFKEIIKAEFGIEQNFLKLLRLGPNVTNLIEMKYTERKNFIFSLLPESEIYNTLYKKLSEELRGLNSKISILSNKLINLSADNIDSMKVELEDTNKELLSIDNELNELNSEIYTLQGKISVILNNKSIDEYTSSINTLEEDISELKDSIIDIKISIKNGTSTSIEDISKNIGKLDYRKKQIDERLLEIEDIINNLNTEYNKLKDIKAISNNEYHMNQLRDVYNDLKEKYDYYTEKLNNFECKYSYQYLATFIDDLNIVKDKIEELSEYNKESINFIIKHSENLSSYATNKINILTGRKINLQKEVNNYIYSADYTPSISMYRPPFCPTDSCPYYTTHPCKMKKDNKDESKLEDLKNKILSLDVEIEKYTELPILQKKYQSFMSIWNKSYDVLNELNCLNSNSVYLILTNLKYTINWYNHNKLIDILEKCKMREEYYEVKERMLSVKNELTDLENSTDSNIDDKIDTNRSEYNKIYNELVSLGEEKVNITNQLSILEEAYNDAQYVEKYKNDLIDKERLLESYNRELSIRKDNLLIIDEYNTVINKNKYSIQNINTNKTILVNKADKLKLTINDIEYSKKEYEDYNNDREILREIISATSAKDGIPLVLIKVFLDNCKEIVNELISDVFDDNLEILDFVLTDTEFKIPYMCNGMVIDDIESASQGQRSIISIALSFALIRQSMFDYNIMLLDEIDGPLYKKDRDKFISILFKQINAINANQVFLITHNNTFEGSPVNILMTTEEVIDKSNKQKIYHLY
jgi:predicted  nucleic acid-binding Zn-ribbon protein